MILYVDSREHWTHSNSKDTHIRSYLERHGIAYEVRKLDCGDYMLDRGTISVDRKASLQEVAQNLFAKNDKARFWKEIRRAREMGIRLFILIEDSRCRSIKDVSKWNSQYGKVSGRSLMDEIYKVHISYGVDFLFCHRRSAAKRIMEILTGKDGA